MTAIRTWLARTMAIVTGRSADADLHADIQAHLDLLATEHERRGLSPRAAREAARRDFGGLEQIKECYRDQRGWTWLDDVRRDVAHAWRGLARTPVFTLVTIITLGLGIGATTAIFTLMDAVVLRQLPVRAPERLVSLEHVYRGNGNSYFSYPHVERLRSQGRTLSGLAFIAGLNRVNVIADGDPDIALGELVSGEYFTLLGVRPQLGRLLLPEDDRADHAVAVISHGFWQRRFGADPAVVGRSIRVNGVPVTIVGVMPREFYGVTVGSVVDVRMPLRMHDQLAMGGTFWNQPWVSWLSTIGRLEPGVTAAQAATELTTIFKGSLLESPEQAPGAFRAIDQARIDVFPAQRGIAPGGSVRGFAPALRMLMAVAALVLLVACANIASLLLARGETRRIEMSLRLALGASRGRLIRQLVTESALIGIVGGVLGLAVAAAGSAALVRMVSTASRLVELDIDLDFRVLAFAGLVSAFAILLFGLAPAFRASQVNPGAGFGALRIAGGEWRLRWHKRVLTAQMALCVILLFAAGLFVRSVRNVLQVDPGFTRENVLMFSMDSSLTRYPRSRTAAVFAQTLEAIRTIPGVTAVSSAVARPIDQEAYLVGGIGFVDGRTLSQDQRIRFAFNVVSPGYFSTLQVPVRLGRDFRPQDTALAPRVGVVNETLALQLFPGQNPVGRRIGQGEGDAFEIVGVVPDMRYGRLTDPPRGVLYLPLSQTPWANQVTFLLRYTGAVAPVIESVRAKMSAVDPALPLYRVSTLEAAAGESLVQPRLLANVSTLFGSTAMLLAAVGLYGLMSFAMARRAKEIGLRMALGATRSEVIRMALRQSLVPVAIGALVGVPAAYLTMSVARSLLFGVTPADPMTMGITLMVLIVVAASAGYIPARRAASADPLVALRYE